MHDNFQCSCPGLPVSWNHKPQLDSNVCEHAFALLYIAALLCIPTALVSPGDTSPSLKSAALERQLSAGVYIATC